MAESVIPNVEGQIAQLQSGIAIMIEGNQTSHTGGAAKGAFVYVRGSTISGIADGLYTAAQIIPANTAITSAYLAEVDGGGLNAVNDKISNIVSVKVTTFTTDRDVVIQAGSSESLTTFDAAGVTGTFIRGFWVNYNNPDCSKIIIDEFKWYSKKHVQAYNISSTTATVPAGTTIEIVQTVTN